MTVAAIAVVGVGAAVAAGGAYMSSKEQSKAGKQAQAAQDQNMQQQQQLASEARDQNIPIINDAARQAMGYVAPYAESGLQANTALQQQMGLIPDANGYFNIYEENYKYSAKVIYDKTLLETDSYDTLEELFKEITAIKNILILI